LKKLSTTITNLLSTDTYNNKEVEILCEDDFYTIPLGSNLVFDVSSDLIFYSKNGTIFDFQNSSKSQISILFRSELSNKKKIIFRNITFQNFIYVDQCLFFFDFSTDNNNFQIEFENCKFDNIQSRIFHFFYTKIKIKNFLPQVIIKNCTFM
ncbi:hypothetical protein BCR36DRAFT_253022, partial [Piromyces finnis]